MKQSTGAYSALVGPVTYAGLLPTIRQQVLRACPLLQLQTRLLCRSPTLPVLPPRPRHFHRRRQATLSRHRSPLRPLSTSCGRRTAPSRLRPWWHLSSPGLTQLPSRCPPHPSRTLSSEGAGHTLGHCSHAWLLPLPAPV